MAHLLGSKACIESLRADIDDLEQVIRQLIGRTGSLKCHSWKFPDKLATDVNIEELLQRYNFGKNELDNQVSHIVLFEILIDRLLLILHGSWRFLHEMPIEFSARSIQSASTLSHQTNLSVGLVVKKYWKKLFELFTTLQHQQKEFQQKSYRVDNSVPISKTSSNQHQSSQTIETSFAPCSSCKKLQDCLRHQGQSISELCHQLNLPSTLAHHRSLTKNKPEWFSSDDIDQWFDYQKKDFLNLTEQLETMKNETEKLKVHLKTNENQYKKLDENHRKLQQAINEDKLSKKHLQQLHDMKILELKAQFEKEIARLNDQIQRLSHEIERFEQCQQANQEKDKRIEELESLEKNLKNVERERTESNEKIRSLEKNQIRLQTELEVLKRDLDDRQRELQKERTRIENFIRQEQNSQSKQLALIASHDELSQQCQAFEQKIVDLEDERDRLQRQLRRNERETNVKHDPSKRAPLFLLDNEIAERETPTERKVVTPTARSASSSRTTKSAARPVYRCSNCEKSYDDKRNYDIHKLYCRT